MALTVDPFVAHVRETPDTALPPEVIERAKIFIYDTFAVGVAGVGAAITEQVAAATAQWGDAPPGEGARVLGRAGRRARPTAAFLNAFQIHCQEFDCVHERAVVHPLATILAALMVEADRPAGGPPVSGAAFIAAVALSVDVAAGLGVAVSSPIRFFRPATAGIFGATLGVARLRGFSAETTRDALGQALGHASGAMQAHTEGKPTLPVQIANAARAAHYAADLAQAGVPGPHDVLTGPYGYLPLYELAYDLDPIIAGLGDTWRILEVSHKPFPTGRAAQGGIPLMKTLRAEGCTHETLDRLVLTAPPLIERLVGRRPVSPLPANYARLCFAYLGARTLITGDVGLEDFTPMALDDPATHALAQRIHVVSDGGPDPATYAPQIAAATLKDGRTLEARTDHLYGSPEWPMDEAARIAKLDQCLGFGFGRKGDWRGVLDMLTRLETVEDMRQVIDALTLDTAETRQAPAQADA